MLNAEIAKKPRTTPRTRMCETKQAKMNTVTTNRKDKKIKAIESESPRSSSEDEFTELEVPHSNK